MSSWRSFRRSLGLGLWIGLVAIVLAAAWFNLLALYRNYAPALAARLVDQAHHEQGSASLRDLQLALWLEPSNTTVRGELAGKLLRQGNPQQARGVEQGHERDSAQLATVSMLTGLELGDTAQAQSLAAAIKELGASQQQLWDSQVVLAATGVPQNDAALASPTGIARELYALRLPQATNRQLDNAKADTLTYYQLRVATELEAISQTKQRLQNAQEWLKKAIILTPANIELRQQLRDIDHRLKDTAGANEQQQRIDQLSSGKP